jgi:hypothetical protein
MAKNMTTRQTKSAVDSNSTDINQPSAIELPSTGDVAHSAIEIEKADGETLKHKAAALAFMEEPVDVVVHESTDPNAEPVVSVFNNGIVQHFVRGATQTVKRKYVEVLARAKQTSLNTGEVTDNSGGRAIRINRHRALRYPFSVVRDTNRKGPEWLKKVIADA